MGGTKNVTTMAALTLGGLASDSRFEYPLPSRGGFEASGRRSHETVADSSLVLIEGASHGFNATHAEHFNRALLDFLG